MLDNGSAGEASFPGFRENIVYPSPERVYVVINIGSIGLTARNRYPD
ncbi:hypothetical protein [Mesorhizobium sp. WSM2561]|nr:hypothetical protein [Mesorhizobium sp. WSM2561]